MPNTFYQQLLRDVSKAGDAEAAVFVYDKMASAGFKADAQTMKALTYLESKFKPKSKKSNLVEQITFKIGQDASGRCITRQSLLQTVFS